MAKKGLGLGLDALFMNNPSDSTAEGEAFAGAEKKDSNLIKISDIDPNKNQPRKLFFDDSLEELAESIRTHGILQPLALRATPDGRYQIIAGERRFRAAKRAGLTEVPAVIVDADDRTVAELALIENLQREDLNPVEEAEGFKALLDEFSLTQEEAAARLGKSRSTFTNALRLLSLSSEALALLREGRIERGHAKVILGLTDKSKQAEVAYTVAEKNLNVRQTEELVRRTNKEGLTPPDATDVVEVDYVAALERDLTKSLGRKVRLIHGKKKGKIELEYYGNDDLDVLIKALSRIK
ncbi:MAG: ParB/RepB/Spo0J family partition protein [Oscillospiraceae bacterium]|nr:ParB/RepB/Spo0J family partition protein [Oscillospiraceae bacterium]MBQ4544717.1 ParB/RepB/Spo0J family partition protein [Oscillospiraceae bacterium]MBQ6901960.1 ParB/RepB/Spo0J family partition protein [Oscillospiraceae bacterium]